MDEPGQRMVRIAACLRGLFSARQSSADFGYGFPAPSTARILFLWPSFRRALAVTVAKLEPRLLLLPETDTSPAVAAASSLARRD